MRVMTLISTPKSLIETRLLQLLQREGVAYRVECWSFRWWHCGNCSCTVPSAGRVEAYSCKCAGCGIMLACEKRPPGIYVTTTPTIEPVLPVPH